MGRRKGGRASEASSPPLFQWTLSILSLFSRVNCPVRSEMLSLPPRPEWTEPRLFWSRQSMRQRRRPSSNPERSCHEADRQGSSLCRYPRRQSYPQHGSCTQAGRRFHHCRYRWSLLRPVSGRRWHSGTGLLKRLQALCPLLYGSPGSVRLHFFIHRRRIQDDRHPKRVRFFHNIGELVDLILKDKIVSC